MITAADEIYIDLSTSCTKDVVVAKLLGWLQGPIRRKYINVTEDGISEDQLPYLHKMEEPISEQLLELREVAHRKLVEAFNNGVGDDVLSELEGRVNLCDKKILLAAQYFRDIDDELAKGDSSKLRVDPVATVTPDNPYITLSTLDHWAKDKYGISVLNADPDQPANQNPELAGSAAQLKLDLAKSQELNEKYAGGKPEVSLLVTFAFLIDAFLDQVRKHGDEKQKETFFKGKDNTNFSAIAEHLEDLMATANGTEKDGKRLLDDQQKKSIGNRIRDALAAKAAALPKKKLPV